MVLQKGHAALWVSIVCPYSCLCLTQIVRALPSRYCEVCEGEGEIGWSDRKAADSHVRAFCDKDPDISIALLESTVTIATLIAIAIGKAIVIVIVVLVLGLSELQE